MAKKKKSAEKSSEAPAEAPRIPWIGIIVLSLVAVLAGW